MAKYWTGKKWLTDEGLSVADMVGKVKIYSTPAQLAQVDTDTLKMGQKAILKELQKKAEQSTLEKLLIFFGYEK